MSVMMFPSPEEAIKNWTQTLVEKLPPTRGDPRLTRNGFQKENGEELRGEPGILAREPQEGWT